MSREESSLKRPTRTAKGAKSSQKAGVRARRCRAVGRASGRGRSVCEVAAEAGVGGAAGRKMLGRVAREERSAMVRVRCGMLAGKGARKGEVSWARAPPKGLAREAMAVAETRPEGENHSSL